MRRLLLATAVTVLLTGCGSTTPGPASTSSEDVVAGEQKVEAIAALLPEDVRKTGTVKVGSSIGTPPSAFYPDPATKKPAGVDIDITDGVAKVLGISVDRQEAAFESILPALGSGKFDVGTGNFGVTTARLKTIDFVTYIDDGQGFAVRKDDTAIQPRPDPALRADHRNRRRNHLRDHAQLQEGRLRRRRQEALRGEGLLRKRRRPHQPPAKPGGHRHVHHQRPALPGRPTRGPPTGGPRTRAGVALPCRGLLELRGVRRRFGGRERLGPVCRDQCGGQGRENAQRGQQVRSDMDIVDLLRMVSGIASVAYDDDEQRERVLRIALDGVRRCPAGRAEVRLGTDDA